MPKKYKHITLDDRTLIQTQLQQGFKPAAIAASTGRHCSCVTRELARNGWKSPSAARSVGRQAIAGGYASSRANLRARKLSVMPRVERKLVVGNPLWRKVSEGLQQGLSPEQVEGHTEAHERTRPPVPRNDLPSNLCDAQRRATHRHDYVATLWPQ